MFLTRCLPRLQPCPDLLQRPSPRQFWSWSKPPGVSFPLVTPAPTHTEFTALETVRSIPDHIRKPDYALSSEPDTRLIPRDPVIWTEVEIIKIREACQLARKILSELKSVVQPGLTTDSLDHLARELAIIHQAYPSPLNFNGYPKSISTSVNNVAAHGIPDARELVSGDILNIDVTVFLDGYHGDCSDTVPVGEVDTHALHLIQVAQECLQSGIEYCKPGRTLTGLGKRIHQHAKSNNCAVVPCFLGHGIGDFFHGPPEIYHSLNNYPGVIRPGMVFTIEPCISEGDRRVRTLEDGWTAVTLDNSRTAQVEHTVVITERGAEILTE